MKDHCDQRPNGPGAGSVSNDFSLRSCWWPPAVSGTLNSPRNSSCENKVSQRNHSPSAAGNDRLLWIQKKKKQSLVTEHPHGLDPKSYTPFSPGGPWGSSKEPQPQLLLPPLLPSLTQHLLLAGGQSGQGLMAERMVSTFGSLHYLRSKCLAIHSILGYMQIISKST